MDYLTEDLKEIVWDGIETKLLKLGVKIPFRGLPKYICEVMEKYIMESDRKFELSEHLENKTDNFVAWFCALEEHLDSITHVLRDLTKKRKSQEELQKKAKTEEEKTPIAGKRMLSDPVDDRMAKKQRSLFDVAISDIESSSPLKTTEHCTSATPKFVIRTSQKEIEMASTSAKEVAPTPFTSRASTLMLKQPDHLKQLKALQDVQNYLIVGQFFKNKMEERGIQYITEIDDIKLREDLTVLFENRNDRAHPTIQGVPTLYGS